MGKEAGEWGGDDGCWRGGGGEREGWDEMDRKGNGNGNGNGEKRGMGKRENLI